MKCVSLLSSPSSHTQLLLAFISMLVMDTYVFIMRVVMMCLLHAAEMKIGTTRT